MGISSILIISLAVGGILIVAGGVMMHMANLVKSAYEIKVQINNDVDDRLAKMGDELNTKSDWVKRDLSEDIGKAQQVLAAENAKRMEDVIQMLAKRLDALEEMVGTERGEFVRALLVRRQSFGQVDVWVKGLARDLNRVQTKLGMPLTRDAAATVAAMPATEGIGTPSG